LNRPFVLNKLSSPARKPPKNSKNADAGKKTKTVILEYYNMDEYFSRERISTKILNHGVQQNHGCK